MIPSCKILAVLLLWIGAVFVSPAQQAETSRPNDINAVFYWGQGDTHEKSLDYYCKLEGVTMVVLSFIADYTGGHKKSPVLNLSNKCDDVEDCPDVARDIQFCQQKGIKILMSMGGAAGAYHTESWEPDLLAWWMWNKFLGGQDRTLSRPFGDVILDGLDFDPEASDPSGYDRLIHVLRTLFKTQYPVRSYLITAAPQCPDLEDYKDNAMHTILYPSSKYDAYPDMVFVQFYNNYCSASKFGTSSFNFDEWDEWANGNSRKSKVLLGLIGKENHEDTGYVEYEKLTAILDAVSGKASFGGIMMWDASLAFNNPIHALNNQQYGAAAAAYLTRSSLNRYFSLKGQDSLPSGIKLQEDESPQQGGYHSLAHLTPVSSQLMPVPCSGQAFVLLQSVTCSRLAQNLGYDTRLIDTHLRDKVGIDPAQPLVAGAGLCFEAVENTIVLRYAYNDTLLLSDMADHHYFDYI
ncbi:glycoside hydrolase superfamily [Syncephalastrum racemosum]|uniref:chitinase n=1 Tax=Syncephalastrum racemosum TaxID=13706 RepID=A0A1X2HPF8_SYNRA|nr:glycoside hydrolase superfamily [Syncephalastrum racemosum]